MHHPLTIGSLGTFLGLVALPGLCAQTNRYVPAANTMTEGSTLSVYPFGYTNPRAQQLWSAASISKNTSLVLGVSYRMDTVSRTAAEAGRSYTGVSFSIGTTTVTTKTMSTTFANNITSTMTQVVSGNWNLPAQPAPTTSPAPFNIDFAWTTPYIFHPASGNLLLDIVLPGPSGKSNYFVDAEVSNGMAASATPFGTSGSFASPETFALTANTATLAPGGTFELTCGNFSKSYVGSVVIGLSDTAWGTTKLPLDLGILGAPKNSLYVSMDLQLGFNPVKTASGLASGLKTSIPNGSIFNGLRLFAQAWYADAQANSAGIVATHGLAMTLADPNAGPETQQVGNHDASATTGTFAIAFPAGGPIARFVGVF